MKRTTINQHLARTIGLKRALYVETFVMLWSLYRATHEGADPETIDALADEIGKSRAQVFRWQADFREAFSNVAPDWSTPGDLLDYATKSRQIKRGGPLTVRGVGGVRIGTVS